VKTVLECGFSGWPAPLRSPAFRIPKLFLIKFITASRGKRAYGKVPRNRGKNTTLIAAITLEGAMGESMTTEGATDALAFSRLTLSTSLPLR
jgi:hypothetical protein